MTRQVRPIQVFSPGEDAILFQMFLLTAPRAWCARVVVGGGVITFMSTCIPTQCYATDASCLGTRAWCYATDASSCTGTLLDATLQMLLLALAHVLDATLWTSSWAEESFFPWIWQFWKLGGNCANFKRWNVTHAQPGVNKGLEMLRWLPEINFLGNASTTFGFSNQHIPDEKWLKTGGFYIWTLFPNCDNRRPSSRRCHHVFDQYRMVKKGKWTELKLRYL